MFYHRQRRNTWEIRARKCQRRNAMEQKRLKKHGRTRKDAPISVGVVEAARSSRVTQTISSVHNRPHGFGMDTRLFFCLKYCFLLLPCRFSARLFLWGQAVGISVSLCWYSSVHSALAHAVCSPFTYRIATPCLVSIRTGVFCTYGTSITPTNR